MSAGAADGRGRSDPYAVFRPRQGRRVALTLAVLAVVIFTTVALSMPWVDPRLGGATVIDRLLRLTSLPFSLTVVDNDTTSPFRFLQLVVTDGVGTLTSTPLVASSFARDLVSAISPAFEAL